MVTSLEVNFELLLPSQILALKLRYLCCHQASSSECLSMEGTTSNKRNKGICYWHMSGKK